MPNIPGLILPLPIINNSTLLTGLAVIPGAGPGGAPLAFCIERNPSLRNQRRRGVTKDVAPESEDMCKEEERERQRATRAGQREKVAAVWKKL